MDANTKANQETRVTQEQMMTNQEKMIANMRAGDGEMVVMLDAHYDRMMASLGKTEATVLKTRDEGVEYETKNRDVPKEGVVVKPVDGWKKRHRSLNLNAGRRGKPKELTRDDGGSRRKLAAPAGRCPAMQESHGARKDWTRCKVERATRNIGWLRKNLWTHLEVGEQRIYVTSGRYT
jgi:hypothetical protein